jgi:hypothetical protein
VPDSGREVVVVATVAEPYAQVLEDLEQIRKIQQLSYDDREVTRATLRTPTARAYLDGIFVSKPEETLSEYLFKPILGALGVHLHPQITTSEGWVDYLITNGFGNPVAIELKSLHARHDDRIRRVELQGKIEALRREFEDTKKNQVINYLKDYDYVIVTNLDQVYYFNREAMIGFSPYCVEDITRFLEDLRRTKSPWDLARQREDTVPRNQLDKTFFEDLKKWYSRFENIEWDLSGSGLRELKILLLNKFIFSQTLEDFGLVPFRFLRDAYEAARAKWEVKGPGRVLSEFFDGMDEWFYAYYDTEMFRTPILSHLLPTRKNHAAFIEAIESVLGFGLWDNALGKGLTHYNYRYIDEDIFGKSYETFLAEHRKEQGIYYTPQAITAHMAEGLVSELFEPVLKSLLSAIETSDFAEAMEKAKTFVSISILDPACGSGSFLVKALRRVYAAYKALEEQTRWAEQGQLWEPEDFAKRRVEVQKIRELIGLSPGEQGKRRMICLIIVRHIHGVDLDSRALDVAKVNLWKEAVKLAPDAFRYRSLTGDAGHILPNLELNFIHANTLVSPPDSAVVEAITVHRASDVAKLVALRQAYLRDPFKADTLNELIELRSDLKTWFTQACTPALPSTEPFLSPIDLFYLYFDENGVPVTRPVCDGIIGNPPWENIKPISKEFAAYHPEIFGNISKFSLAGPAFETMFEKKIKEPEVAALWKDYVGGVVRLSEYVTARYHLYGDGDLSLQKLFLERSLELSKQAVVLLLPSNFHTDAGTLPLRQEIMTNWRVKELLSFENRGKVWFGHVHPQYKFDIVHLIKGGPTESFRARFYIHDVSEVTEAFDYSVADIEYFSPYAKGISEFRNEADREMARRVKDAHPLLKEESHWFLSELHMSRDHALFGGKPTDIPLYEGKMIHQYDPFFREPAIWVPEAAGKSRLLQKEESRMRSFLAYHGKTSGLSKKDLKVFVDAHCADALERFRNGALEFDCEEYRLVYRSVGRSTDGRTLFSTLVPKSVFIGHSLNFPKPFAYRFGETTGIEQFRTITDLDMLVLMALFNTFVLDYYIRLRVSANITVFFIEELPIPTLAAEDKQQIADFAWRLLNTGESNAFDEFAARAGLRTTHASDAEKKETRARLEHFVASRIYGLDKSDMKCILSTFTFGTPDKGLMEAILSLF